jgi:hypothetical protein
VQVAAVTASGTRAVAAPGTTTSPASAKTARHGMGRSERNYGPSRSSTSAAAAPLPLVIAST